VTDERTDEIEITDFSISRKSKPFRVDGDVFHAHPIIPIPAMQDMVRAARDMGKLLEPESGDIDTMVEGIAKIFDVLLPEDEAHLMRERINSRDGRVAIDLRLQLMPIINHLMGAYGLRPTEPSSDSSAGPPDDGSGTTSPVGALPAASSQPL